MPDIEIPDEVIPMCRYASQATQKIRFNRRLCLGRIIIEFFHLRRRYPNLCRSEYFSITFVETIKTICVTSLICICANCFITFDRGCIASVLLSKCYTHVHELCYNQDKIRCGQM